MSNSINSISDGESTSFRIPNENCEYWLKSKFDVLAIIRDLVKRDARLTLHLPTHEYQSSMILGITEDKHLALDLSLDDPVNNKILESKQLVLHTRLDGVEVTAVIKPRRKGIFDGDEAIFAEVPDKLHRYQRRSDLRVKIPSYEKSDCVLKMYGASNGPAALKKVDAKLLDISLGGVRLQISDELAHLPNLGNYLQGFSMLIDDEPMTIDLKLKHLQERKITDNKVSHEIGCAFVRLSPHERKSIAKMVRKIEYEWRIS